MFIRLVALLAVLDALAAMPQPRVCIVGGGMAGIAAALKLQQSNVSYVLVEASSRLGGRVWPFKYEDITLQYGAFYLHGIDNDIHKIAKEEGLLIENKEPPFMRDLHTVKSPKFCVDMSTARKFEKFVSPLEEKYSEMAEETDEGWETSLAAATYTDSHAYVKKHKLNETLFSKLTQMYLYYNDMEWAARADEFSLANFDMWDDENEGNEMVMKNPGYRVILDKLTAGINKTNIRLNSTVRNINYTGDSVKVQLTSGDVIVCDKALVTVSLGVLKAKSASLFTPPLPAQKQKAIREQGFGTMYKVFIVFPTRWWQEDVVLRTIGSLSTPIFARGAFFTATESDSKHNILTLWLTSVEGEVADGMNDDALISAITLHLRQCYRDRVVPTPTKIIRHNWQSDPLHYGSYSWMSTKSASSFDDPMAVLAQPIKRDNSLRVCFAGEATHSTMYQTVLGAYLSGQREARRIISEKHK